MCVCVSESVRACVRVCVCSRPLSQPRRDDWICQPAGTLITSAIFRLTSHNRSHLWEGNELGHSGSPDPGRASDSNLFRGRRKSNEQNNADGVQSAFAMEKFFYLLLKDESSLSLSRTAGTMTGNKCFDVNHHYWVLS